MNSKLQETVGLVFPTNEPDTAFEFLFKSLENLKVIAPISTFLINFQSPWTPEQMEEAINIIKSYGFGVKQVFSTYEIKGKGLIPINRIREESARLMPNAELYALIDDDMTFLSPSAKMSKTGGEQYLDAIHYMINHPKCGIALFGGSLYRKTPSYYLKPVDIVNTYLTTKGIIYKNISKDASKGLLIPIEAIDLVGSDEERVAAGYRLVNGYYPVKTRNTRVNHYENHRVKNSTKRGNLVTSGTDAYGWNTQEILEKNNTKFIRENFNPKYRGNGAFDVCSLENYLNNGGIDVYDEKVAKSHEVSYEFTNSEDILNEIIRSINNDNR